MHAWYVLVGTPVDSCRRAGCLSLTLLVCPQAEKHVPELFQTPHTLHPLSPPPVCMSCGILFFSRSVATPGPVIITLDIHGCNSAAAAVPSRPPRLACIAPRTPMLLLFLFRHACPAPNNLLSQLNNHALVNINHLLPILLP